MRFIAPSISNASSKKRKIKYRFPIFQSTGNRHRQIGRLIFRGLVLGLAFATFFAPLYIRAQSGAVRFAVIGDYGGDTTEEGDVANRVKSWNPDFVITTGDNNYPDGAASTIDRNIGKYYHEFIFPYQGTYGAGAIINRFFPSLGNHDWHAPGAQPYLDYFTLPGNERYYDFVQGPVHLYAVDSDSSEPDGISGTSVQANWLRNRMTASTEPWKIVYFHHPPYSSGSNHGSTETMRWSFQQWGASAVLAGHNHVYERIMVNGLAYFVNGLGGTSRYGFDSPLPGTAVRYNADFGAMLVTADAESIRFQFITRTGAVIDDYTIGTPPPVPVINAPGNLTAATVSASQVDLSWTDNSSNEDGFKIERCSGAGCMNFSEIAQVTANDTTYSDSGLTANTYVYRVRAFNADGNSAYSNTAQANTNPASEIFGDDFNDGVRDPSKWNLGLFSRSSSTFDSDVEVLEQNGRLAISPIARENGSNYNGYTSAQTWNMTDALAGVEVVDIADNKAVTIFSIGTDSNNWYSFRAKGGTLYLESRIDGNTTRNTIDYEPSQQRFWRFRHILATDDIVFETSANGIDWSVQQTVSRQITISAVRIELVGGTNQSIRAPGTALFDNFRLETNGTP